MMMARYCLPLACGGGAACKTDANGNGISRKARGNENVFCGVSSLVWDGNFVLLRALLKIIRLTRPPISDRLHVAYESLRSPKVCFWHSSHTLWRWPLLLRASEVVLFYLMGDISLFQLAAKECSKWMSRHRLPKEISRTISETGWEGSLVWDL